MKKLAFPHWKTCLLFPERVVLSFTLLGVVAGAGALFALSEKQDSPSIKLFAQLNTLQKNMTTLQDTVNKPIPRIDLNATNEQIKEISQQLERVRAQNANHINLSLNKTETALTNRLEAIQQLVRHLDDKQSPIKFLPPKALPFQVVSLDSIQHVPVASIAYNFKTIPLEKDDSLAGWQVLAIDYGKQHIEFVNAKKEHVLLTHEQIG